MTARPLQSALPTAMPRGSMVFSETVKLAIDTFRASKVRFMLTMLGMVIGSASIILVVTVGMTGTDYALDTINGLGPNKVEMQYAGGNVMGPDNVSTPDYMTREDMDAVLSDPVLGPQIIASSPMLEFHDRLNTGNGTSQDTMELGVSPQYKDVRNLRPLAGRFFDDEDAAQHAKVAVIATPALPAGAFASKLFGSPQDAIGRTINIHGMPLTVIGVYAESSFDAGQSEIGDGAVLVPYEVARYFTGTNTLKELFFTLRSADQVEPAKDRITEIIKSRHYATSVYKGVTLTEVLGIMRKIANALTIVFSLAAFITLIVAGVGIMNSMLANIQARTREIGIRKALGATKREIRLQFLIESTFLSLSGGIVGTIIGMTAPPAVGFLIPIIGKLFGADIPPLHIPVSWLSAVLALGTSVIVGVAFGTLPANRAASLDPVETLKYE